MKWWRAGSQRVRHTAWTGRQIESSLGSKNKDKSIEHTALINLKLTPQKTHGLNNWLRPLYWITAPFPQPRVPSLSKSAGYFNNTAHLNEPQDTIRSGGLDGERGNGVKGAGSQVIVRLCIYLVAAHACVSVELIKGCNVLNTAGPPSILLCGEDFILAAALPPACWSTGKCSLLSMKKMFFCCWGRKELQCNSNNTFSLM